MKTILKIILSILGILLLAYVSYCIIGIVSINKPRVIGPGLSPYYSGIDYDGTYIIEGQKVTLDHGKSEVRIPNSNSEIMTQYFGNGIKTDFDNDGRVDDAFIITQTTGGSGTFFYFVARLNKANGPVGSEAVFIGDRIAPQSTELSKDGSITVNYADRGPKDSFADKPSVGVSLKLMFDLSKMRFNKI